MDLGMIDLTNLDDDEELPAVDLVVVEDLRVEEASEVEVVENRQVEQDPEAVEVLGVEGNPEVEVEVEVAEGPEMQVEVDLPWEGVGPRPYRMSEKSRILNYLYDHQLIPYYKKPVVYQMMIRDCPELAERTVEGLRALVRRVLPRIEEMPISRQAKHQFQKALLHVTATSVTKAQQQAARQRAAQERAAQQAEARQLQQV